MCFFYFLLFFALFTVYSVSLNYVSSLPRDVLWFRRNLQAEKQKHIENYQIYSLSAFGCARAASMVAWSWIFLVLLSWCGSSSKTCNQLSNEGRSGITSINFSPLLTLLSYSLTSNQYVSPLLSSNVKTIKEQTFHKRSTNVPQMTKPSEFVPKCAPSKEHISI
jgi:hypothetical protein